MQGFNIRDAASLGGSPGKAKVTPSFGQANSAMHGRELFANTTTPAFGKGLGELYSIDQSALMYPVILLPAHFGTQLCQCSFARTAFVASFSLPMAIPEHLQESCWGIGRLCRLPPSIRSPAQTHTTCCP
jgi:hypothetical protein